MLILGTESLAIGSSEKLETANNNDNSTFVAMYIIVSGIAAMTIIGVTIYLCYKVSHCRGRPPDKNTPVEHQHGTLNEVVVHDAGKKVADPEKEENNMTSTDLTTSTQVYRVIKPRSTTQRGCELETSNYREYDEEAMRGSVKPDSIILGETSDKPVERYGQETDENSNAYYFSTMVRLLETLFVQNHYKLIIKF